MDKKIFWDNTMGTVYWMEDGDVMFAPMNNDGTCHLDGGGQVEVWDEVAPEHKALILSKIS